MTELDIKKVSELEVVSAIATGSDLIANVDIGGGLIKTRRFAASKIVLGTNLIFVDSVTGNDTSGLRGYRNAPFLTPAAALAAAASGDTIIVFPGTYSVTTSLLKSGVNWFLYPGSRLQCTNSAIYMFDDGGNTVVSYIGGFGRLTTVASGKLVQLTGSNSYVVINCQEVNCNGGISANLTDGLLSLTVVDNCNGRFINQGGQLHVDAQYEISNVTVSSGALSTQIRCGGAGDIALAADTKIEANGDIGNLSITQGTAVIRCANVNGVIAAGSSAAAPTDLSVFCNDVTGDVTVDGGSNTCILRLFANDVHFAQAQGTAGDMMIDANVVGGVFVVDASAYALVKNARITNDNQAFGALAPVEVGGGGTVRLQNCVLISNGTPTETVHGILGTETVKFYGGTVGNFVINNITASVGALVVDTDVD